MSLNVVGKYLVTIFFMYMACVFSYHFLFYGKFGNGFFYENNGDFYQEIKRNNADGSVSVIVPSRVVYYENINDYIVVIRKGIDVYMYPDYGDALDKGMLKYYMINVVSGDVSSTLSSDEAKLKWRLHGLNVDSLHSFW